MILLKLGEVILFHSDNIFSYLILITIASADCYRSKITEECEIFQLFG
jgi:hypothetical protein